MRIKKEKEIPESGKMLALTMALLKILILTVIGGIFWLARMVITWQGQFSDLLRGFMP
jgi:hypothetical protein